MREIETLQADPEYYIDEYCRDLKMRLDLRRELLFESIGNYSDLFVQQIDEWKSKLLAKAKENGTRVAEEKLIKCKAKLGQLNSIFESLAIDNIKMEEIMNQKRSKELGELLKQVTRQYKTELLGRETLELKTHDIKMEEMFGTLQMEAISLVS